MSFIIPRHIQDRFWEKVEMCPHGEDCKKCCWLWKAGKKNNGYGQFFVGREAAKVKMVHAHRFAYELLRGPLFPGINICHNCPEGDNKICCNPSHLFVGTQKDNSLDASRKGQLRYRRRPATILRGEAVGNSKLTGETVRQIRMLAKDGVMFTVLARKFSIHKNHVRAIIHRRLWKHIL